MFVSLGSRAGRRRLAASSGSGGSTGRELLNTTRTYYVRADGSPSNNGMSDHSGGAFRQPQEAIDAAAALDLGIYDVNIYVRSGTFDPFKMKTLIGAGACHIIGDTTTPSNCLITGSGNAIEGQNIIGNYDVHGFKLASSANSGIYLSGPAVSCTWGNIDFGAISVAQVWATAGARIVLDADWAITGSAAYHWIIEATATALFKNKTCTLTGTPAFASSFVLCRNTGVIDCSGITFSGSATGVRYTASRQGLIDTGVAGASYFPGNSAGSTATGGQYV